MGEYTPGPWVVDRDSIRNRDCNAYAAINAPGWDEFATVVVRMKNQNEDCADGLANARLIAAAPELLAALEWLRDSGECDEPETQSVIRSAIAKARGE